MALTEYQENSVQIVYSGNVGNPGVVAGGWANDTTIITGMTTNGFSGGAAYKTITNGDTAVITIPSGNRAAYLTTATVSPAYAGTGGETAGPGGRFQVAIDGVDQGILWDGLNGSLSTSGTLSFFYGVLTPLARNLDATSSHTITLTTVGTGPVLLDSVWAVPNAKPAVNLGNLACLGDSWTYGSGSQYTAVQTPNGGYFGSFAVRLARMLQAKIGKVSTFSPRGSVGDRLFGNDRANAATAPGHTGTTRAGGMWRFLSEVVPLSPEYLTIQYGVNDFLLSFANVSDWCRHLQTLLMEIEDTLDVWGVNGTPVKVSVGTPGYVAGSAIQVNALPSNYGAYFDSYEEGVLATYAVCGMFPWCRIATVYEDMDYRNGTVYPNSSGSNQGNHPNEIGHGIIANAHLEALLKGSA